MSSGSLRGALAGVLVVLIASVCIRLGLWQLDRLEQRRALNARLERATALPPLQLTGAALDSVMTHPERYVYRRARAAGRYDSRETLVLRGRASAGRPGVHLVTPLRLEGGDTVLLVDRGWLPAPDAATADPRPHDVPGPVAIDGVLQPVSDAGEPGAALPTGGGATSYTRLDLPTLRARSARTVLPLYLQRLPQPGGEADGGPRPAPLPASSEGPHLGYAVQWFSFAAIAVLGFLILVLRGGRAAPRK